jgi:hypothetical protein
MRSWIVHSQTSTDFVKCPQAASNTELQHTLILLLYLPLHVVVMALVVLLLVLHSCVYCLSGHVASVPSNKSGSERECQAE